TADFQMKNWEGVVGKLCAKLSQWTWVLPQLSYRGRVLVTNNLIAFFLWHLFTLLEPPEPLIKEVQKRIVNFFWAGQHWTRAPVLYLPLQEGGQGLIDLSCRVRTFRLQAAQRLLYGKEIAWADMAYALLRCVEYLNYDKHLFVLNLREMDLSATTLLYKSVLRAWSSVLRISRINAQPFHALNPLIQSSDTVQNDLISLHPTAFPESRNHQSQRSEIKEIKVDDVGEYFCGESEGGTLKFTSGTHLQFEDEDYWIIALTVSNIISVIVITVLVGVLYKNHRKDSSSSNHQIPTNQYIKILK
ncbi:hypothetical protein QTP70_001673, partial [Hemibagrus guttatus]